MLRARAPGQGRALHAAAPHHCAAGCPRPFYQRRPDDVHSARQPSGLSPLSAAPLPHCTHGTRRGRRSPVPPARAERAALSARGCAEAPAPGCARASECAMTLFVPVREVRTAEKSGLAGWWCALCVTGEVGRSQRVAVGQQHITQGMGGISRHPSCREGRFVAWALKHVCRLGMYGLGFRDQVLGGMGAQTCVLLCIRRLRAARSSSRTSMASPFSR